MHAIFDTGASFSCISRGLADHLGLPVSKDLPGSVSGIEGVSSPITGRVLAPTLKFSPEFEIEISHLVVIPSEAPLFLLGNDIFNSHPGYAFLHLRAVGEKPLVELWDATKGRIISLQCASGPQLMRVG